MSKFKVGDVVEATCEEDEPYGITCKGYIGRVVAILEDDLYNDIIVEPISHTNPLYEDCIDANFPVNSVYFKLKREILFEENM